MSTAVVPLDLATPGGYLLVLALIVPVAALLLGFLSGGRNAARIALVALAVGAAVTVAIVMEMLRTGDALVYVMGNWSPPLGIVLRADGLAVAMIAMSVVVLVAIALFARADFDTPAGRTEARAPFVFWIMLLAVWAGLIVVFLAGDLFTLYVAL